MKVLGYGEDALTLWALTNKTKKVLCQLGDESSRDDLTLIYRPSFGRKGGANSSQFGEFDFILGTPKALYLGEAKWDKSPEIRQAGRTNTMLLRPEQTTRHTVFKAYYETWINKQDWNKEDFHAAMEERKLVKPVPRGDSTLFENLTAVLEKCAEATRYSPKVSDVLLVIDSTGQLCRNDKPRFNPPSGFTLVYVNAAGKLDRGLIPLTLAKGAP